jgi:hypothetical protein
VVHCRPNLGLQETYICCCCVLFNRVLCFVLKDERSSQRLVVPSDVHVPLVLQHPERHLFARSQDIANWKFHFINDQLKELGRDDKQGRKANNKRSADDMGMGMGPPSLPPKKKPLKIPLKKRDPSRIVRSESVFKKTMKIMATPRSGTFGRRVLPDCACSGFMVQWNLSNSWTKDEGVQKAHGPREVYLHPTYYPARKGTTCCCFRRKQQYGWTVYSDSRRGRECMFVPTPMRGKLMSDNEADFQNDDVLPEHEVLTSIEPSEKFQALLDLCNARDPEVVEQALGPHHVPDIKCGPEASQLSVSGFVKTLQANKLDHLVRGASINLYRAVSEISRKQVRDAKADDWARFDLPKLVQVMQAERVDCSDRCFRKLSEAEIESALTQGISTCTLASFVAACEKRRKATGERPQSLAELMSCRLDSGVSFGTCKCPATKSGQTWLSFQLARLPIVDADTRQELENQSKKLKAMEAAHRLLLDGKAEASMQVQKRVLELNICGRDFWEEFADQMTARARRGLKTSHEDATWELGHKLAMTLRSLKKGRCETCEKARFLVVRPCNVGACGHKLCVPCTTRLAKPFMCPYCQTPSTNCPADKNCYLSELEITGEKVSCKSCETLFWQAEEKSEDEEDEHEEAQHEEEGAEEELGNEAPTQANGDSFSKIREDEDAVDYEEVSELSENED